MEQPPTHPNETPANLPGAGAARHDLTEARPGHNGNGNGHSAAAVAAPVVATPAVAAAPASPRSAKAPAPPSRKRRRLLWLIPILSVVGAVAVLVGTRYWFESTYFVMTDNAQVTGDLIQAGSLVAGRVQQADLEVGDTVQKNQTIATVSVPQQTGAIPFSDQPLLQHTNNSDAQVGVLSPIAGLVASRDASVGGTVAAGDPIYTLIDPQRVWVEANIDEDTVGRVQRGQAVEVTSVALGKTFEGQVDAVTPASAATFSLLPNQNLSGNFTKVTQWVPVKITVRSGDTVLPLGTSVSVRIQVQPGGAPAWLPWLN